MSLLLSATDTGHEFMVEFDEFGVKARPYTGGPFHVGIRAKEQVYWSLLTGQVDADAAFFAGKIRVRGSIVKAFRVKNKFLALIQRHVTSAGIQEEVGVGR